jgi:hypothetical protein
MSAKRASNSAVPSMGGWPLRCCSDCARVGGVGGGGTGGASLDDGGWGAVTTLADAADDEERWGSGGGGGGIDGARHGGGGATLVIGAPLLVVREDGGEGGLTPGGLRIRLPGLCIGSFRQSCDWWSDDGVDAITGGDRGSRILCALDTELLVERLSFLGGGEGFC